MRVRHGYLMALLMAMSLFAAAWIAAHAWLTLRPSRSRGPLPPPSWALTTWLQHQTHPAPDVTGSKRQVYVEQAAALVLSWAMVAAAAPDRRIDVVVFATPEAARMLASMPACARCRT